MRSQHNKVKKSKIINSKVFYSKNVVTFSGRRHRLFKVLDATFFVHMSELLYFNPNIFFGAYRGIIILPLWVQCNLQCNSLWRKLINDLEMDSSNTYEGNTENCTVMCVMFLKDWGSEVAMIRNLNLQEPHLKILLVLFVAFTIVLVLISKYLKVTFILWFIVYEVRCRLYYKTYKNIKIAMDSVFWKLCLRKRDYGVLQKDSNIVKTLLKNMLIVRFWSVFFLLIYL